MSVKSNHPALHVLTAWFSGTLHEGECAKVEQHLERCESCNALLDSQNLREDPFAQEVRALANGQPRTSKQASGQRIGQYRLLDLLGEGGMGSVWIAQQDEPLCQRVALKIVKAGMDTKEVLGRFKTERQALTLMDHPGIVRVFDAGATESGRSYFVMELVKGICITDYCDQNRLPLTKRLELFLDICDAVQHAHQKGVVHRDIKPSNVLVTLQSGTPAVKVIDFGLARATGQRLTENSGFTGIGQIVGTPSYMSPEQVRCAPDLDSGTDVYSLGVLLYELLAGRPPLDGKRLNEACLAELQRIICDEETPRLSRFPHSSHGELTESAAKRGTDPRSLRRFLRGDMEVIVMKCLEKDRSCRFGSVAELSDDIRRFLSGAPVRARRPSLAAAIRRSFRRHRMTMILASVVLLALISTGIFAVRAIQAEREVAALRQQLQSNEENLGRLESARVHRRILDRSDKSTLPTTRGSADAVGTDLSTDEMLVTGSRTLSGSMQ